LLAALFSRLILSFDVLSFFDLFPRLNAGEVGLTTIGSVTGRLGEIEALVFL